ncbi:Uncharacterized protein Adt_44427 [Abeliophyllum distichum]|uniref:Ubiquitin-like protease family profile domain-containing protein n=1 Tax=Abeliophyllum distichum TaxID=126358 RepID=A0ABD1PAX1_9LAMI
MRKLFRLHPHSDHRTCCKQSLSNPRQSCSDVVVNAMGIQSTGNLLDDRLEFSKEDFRSIDESIQKNGCSSIKGKMKAISSIPFIVDDDSKFEHHLKRIIKPAACLQSPYVRSYRSQGKVLPKEPTLSFQYNFCLDSPSLPDYSVFKKWYSKGLRLSNKVQKFHKDDLKISPAMDVGPVHVHSKMQWVRTIFDQFKKDNKVLDKHNFITSYVTGNKIRFGNSWGDVDHVFILVFMDKHAHWILVHFDISNWHLDVYNSSFKTIRDVVVLNAVEPLRHIIPHLLQTTKVLSYGTPYASLSCRLCKDIPQ